MKFETDRINIFGGALQLALPIQKIKEAEKLQTAANAGKRLMVEVKPQGIRRSLNANAYCWVLCQMLAVELSKTGYTSKEDVYRQAIKDCITPYMYPLRSELVEDFKRMWESRGVGWTLVDMGAAKTAGYNIVACYKGSSCFDKKEMSRLLDCLIGECQMQGIETAPQEEVASLLSTWRAEYER